jgi:DNA polymerase delta subunit 1
MISGTKGSKNFENAEDPTYVLEHDLPIDFDYYLEKQIKPPMMRIYELVIDNPQSLFLGYLLL